MYIWRLNRSSTSSSTDVTLQIVERRGGADVDAPALQLPRDEVAVAEDGRQGLLDCGPHQLPRARVYVDRVPLPVQQPEYVFPVRPLVLSAFIGVHTPR